MDFNHATGSTNYATYRATALPEKFNGVTMYCHAGDPAQILIPTTLLEELFRSAKVLPYELLETLHRKTVVMQHETGYDYAILQSDLPCLLDSIEENMAYVHTSIKDNVNAAAAVIKSLLYYGGKSILEIESPYQHCSLIIKAERSGGTPETLEVRAINVIKDGAIAKRVILVPAETRSWIWDTLANVASPFGATVERYTLGNVQYIGMLSDPVVDASSSFWATNSKAETGKPLDEATQTVNSVLLGFMYVMARRVMQDVRPTPTELRHREKQAKAAILAMQQAAKQEVLNKLQQDYPEYFELHKYLTSLGYELEPFKSETENLLESGYAGVHISGKGITAAMTTPNDKSYTAISGLLAVDNVKAFDKWSKCPISFSVLHWDKEEIASWLKFMGSSNGYKWSNSYRYLDDETRPHYETPIVVREDSLAKTPVFPPGYTEK